MLTLTLEVTFEDGCFDGLVRCGTRILAQSNGWTQRLACVRAVLAILELRLARDGEEVFQ